MQTEDEIILCHKLKMVLEYFNLSKRVIRFHLHKDLKDLHNKIVDFINKLEE